MKSLPQGHRVVSYKAPVGSHIAKVYVLLGPLQPERSDVDDLTRPEVTHRYLSLAALLTAVESGEAWL